MARDKNGIEYSCDYIDRVIRIANDATKSLNRIDLSEYDIDALRDHDAEISSVISNLYDIEDLLERVRDINNQLRTTLERTQEELKTAEHELSYSETKISKLESEVSRLEDEALDIRMGYRL